MRKTFLTKKLWAVAVLSLSAMLPAMAAVDPSDEDKARCFMDNEDDRTITFVFDIPLWNVSNITSVEVRGSFNSWSSDSKYAMAYDERDFWYLTLPYADVDIPGNSGQPEFKFVTNGSTYQNGGSKSFIPEGYVFLNGDKNNIVVFSTDDFETIKENSRTANVLKSVSDFDLTTEAGQEEISNFRQVPGTRQLFRSYHPYKFSKTSNATEPVRMQYVTALAEAKGIKSDICLSENEESNLKSYTIGGTKYTEEIPAYYQDIIDNGRVLYVGSETSVPSYNAVYYRSANDVFGAYVKEIVDFIISERTEAPFLIHCRLGTDRTGVFSGVLAALCGASWPEIAADYQLTNRMGIQEFRDYHLLQYSFRQMLGVEDLNSIEDFSRAMCDYFIGKGYLSQADIDALRLRLTSAETSVSGIAASEESTAPVYYNLQGRRVEEPSSGLYIVRRDTSVAKELVR